MIPSSLLVFRNFISFIKKKNSLVFHLITCIISRNFTNKTNKPPCKMIILHCLLVDFLWKNRDSKLSFSFRHIWLKSWLHDEI